MNSMEIWRNPNGSYLWLGCVTLSWDTAQLGGPHTSEFDSPMLHASCFNKTIDDLFRISFTRVLEGERTYI